MTTTSPRMIFESIVNEDKNSLMEHVNSVLAQKIAERFKDFRQEVSESVFGSPTIDEDMIEEEVEDDNPHFQRAVKNLKNMNTPEPGTREAIKNYKVPSDPDLNNNDEDSIRKAVKNNNLDSYTKYKKGVK
jgi:hypothetical protein